MMYVSAVHGALTRNIGIICTGNVAICKGHVTELTFRENVNVLNINFLNIPDRALSVTYLNISNF